ncbi:MAG TPA: hypothetical protein VFO77_13480, partial [Actinoplanes sp.]|nr:hypothetical protein [Actinoplanes sp.]
MTEDATDFGAGRDALVEQPPGQGAAVEQLTACVETATAAPSLHNSQPWRFRIRDGGVDVYVDHRRHLEVIDPTGREMFISVGAALFTLRLAVRHLGYLPLLTLAGEPAEPGLVARVVPGRACAATSAVAALFDAVPRRHTNRWPFEPSAVAAATVEA